MLLRDQRYVRFYKLKIKILKFYTTNVKYLLQIKKKNYRIISNNNYVKCFFKFDYNIIKWQCVEKAAAL